MNKQEKSDLAIKQKATITRNTDILRNVCRTRGVTHAIGDGPDKLRELISERDAALQIDLPADVLMALTVLRRENSHMTDTVKLYIEQLLYGPNST